MELAGQLPHTAPALRTQHPKLKNKKEQSGLKAALLSGEMIRKLSNNYSADGNGFESDALTRVSPSSEPAPGRIGFLRQAQKNLHDPGVLICCGVQKQTIINEALNRGDCSALFCGGRPDDGNGAELFVKEQSWLGHDQVGLELISNVSAGGTGIGIDSAVEVRECEIAIGNIGGITGFVVPSLEVRDLGAADTQQYPQDFQVGYLLCERGIQAAAALLDEREVESRSVGDGL